MRSVHTKCSVGLSSGGSIAPYPIDVNVITDQYSEATYVAHGVTSCRLSAPRLSASASIHVFALEHGWGGVG